MKSRALFFPAAALLLVSILLILPQTRWLVRLQALTSLRLYHPFSNDATQFPDETAQPYTLSLAEDAQRMQEAEAHHPGDFALRYAQAVEAESNTQITARLRVLKPQFPPQPRFYAGALRHAVPDLHWNRFEETQLYDLPQPELPPQIVPNDPQSLADFDQEAAMGERLDPDNAYFPIMRAIGLFAAHRDSEGWAALERASKESQWREYIPEEVEARWRLHDLAFGDPGAFPRSTIAFSTLFPQYAKLRALARFLLYGAVEEEKAGHFEEGLKRREALRHYGDLMQSQSPSLLGNLTGGALCAIAISQPGGVKPTKSARELKPEQAAQLRLETWSAYATRLGHPELAAQARAESEAFQQIHAVATREQSSNIIGEMFRLAAWWLAGLAVLSNCGWLLLLGGLAFGLARLKRIREARPLPVGAAGGITLALAFSILAACFGITNSVNRFAELMLNHFVLYLVLPGVVLLIIALLRPALRRRLAVGTGAYCLALAVLSLFGPVVYWQAHYLNDLLSALRPLTDYSQPEGALMLAVALSAMLIPAIPILLLIFIIVACVRCRPISVSIVQGFRTLALPLTCLLLLVYGGLLLGTVPQEQIVNHELWHREHNYGPYLAAQAGLPWPGPVR